MAWNSGTDTLDPVLELLADEGLGSPKAIQPGVRLPQGIVGGEVRTEIQTRLANFRAHQERFHREREEYFSATLVRARAAIAAVAGTRSRTPRAG